MQHTVTRCNTLHTLATRTRCNALQQAVTRCNMLQRKTNHLERVSLVGHKQPPNIRIHTATHCNTFQHTTTRCDTLQRTAARCNTLQHTETHLERVSLVGHKGHPRNPSFRTIRMERLGAAKNSQKSARNSCCETLRSGPIFGDVSYQKVCCSVLCCSVSQSVVLQCVTGC